MARKKKPVNNTPYPDYVIEAVARCLWPDIQAFFESEEGKKEFTIWTFNYFNVSPMDVLIMMKKQPEMNDKTPTIIDEILSKCK